MRKSVYNVIQKSCVDCLLNCIRQPFTASLEMQAHEAGIGLRMDYKK